MVSVSPVQVSVNPPPSCPVIRIVGVVQTEALERAKMRLDRIESTGIGRRRHQTDTVVAGEPLEVDVPVRR